MVARAFLFDLDGTLWDSLPWYALVLSEQGTMDIDQALAALTNGKPAATLLRSAGITQRRFKDLCTNGAIQAHPYPGVRRSLEKLMTSTRPLGIVTSLPGWMADPVLELLGISKYISVVVGYGATSRHKPHPEPLLQALRELGLYPMPDIWYVGDTEGDFVATRAAGLSFACALYGYGRVFTDADANLKSFTEVLAL